MDKTSRLNNIINWIKKNTVNPDDLKLFLEGVTKVFKEQRNEIDVIKSKNLDYLDTIAKEIKKDHQNIYTEIEKKDSEIKQTAEKLIELETKVSEIVIPEPIEIDTEKLTKDILELVPEKEATEIVQEINELPVTPENQIDAKHIKNLPSTTVYGGGGRGVKSISKTNTKITDIARSLNFTGTAVSSVTTDNNGNVTVSLASGGSPVSGSPYAVSYFNSLGNDLDSTSTYFEYDPIGLFQTLITENFTETGALYVAAYDGYTIQRYGHGVENIYSRYIITNPSEFSAGLVAEIGSYGTNGVDFLIKEADDNQSWAIPSTTRFVQTSDVTITNTESEETLFGTGLGKLEFPENYFTPGRTIKIRIRGLQSSADNPPIEIKIKLNSDVIASGTVNSGDGTDDGFYIEADIVFRTVGATGTVSAGGNYSETHSTGANIGITQSTVSVIDTTIAQVLDVTWSWGVADVRNSVTSQSALVEVIKPF